MQKPQKQKKTGRLRMGLGIVLFLALWLGGYLAISHYTGTFPAGSSEEVAAFLAQNGGFDAVTLSAQETVGGLTAVLFDPDTPDNPADDGVLVYTPDPLFPSRAGSLFAAGAADAAPGKTGLTAAVFSTGSQTYAVLYGTPVQTGTASFTLGEETLCAPVTAGEPIVRLLDAAGEGTPSAVAID